MCHQYLVFRKVFGGFVILGVSFFDQTVVSLHISRGNIYDTDLARLCQVLDLAFQMIRFIVLGGQDRSQREDVTQCSWIRKES